MTNSSAEETWESRYQDSNRVWSGQPNKVLVDVVKGMPPGRALDLGCGEGADAVWLAQQGWRVTGVDVSRTALDRAARAAEEAGISPEHVRWVAQDLATWTPGGQYDLVSAFFLHSPVDFPRQQVLRRAADAVASGGHLLVVGHAAPPPWASSHHHGDGSHHDSREFPSVDEQLAELALATAEWEIVLAESRGRDATGPDGEPATLDDVIVLARRAPQG